MRSNRGCATESSRLRRRCAASLKSGEESRHELRELYDRGDLVVAAVSWHIRSRGSDRELVNEEAHSWTLREGRIARFEWGQDLGKALEAAGVPD